MKTGLKAVNLLKKEIDLLEITSVELLNDIETPQDIKEHAQSVLNLYKEALAELQELTQEKSCEGCKYDTGEIFRETCSVCNRYFSDHYTPKG